MIVEAMRRRDYGELDLWLFYSARSLYEWPVSQDTKHSVSIDTRKWRVSQDTKKRMRAYKMLTGQNRIMRG